MKAKAKYKIIAEKTIFATFKILNIMAQMFLFVPL